MAVEIIKNFTTTCNGKLHAVIAASTIITSTIEQVVFAGGSTTSFFFSTPLTSTEDIELDNILSTWLCPSINPTESVDAQLISVSGVEGELLVFNLDELRNNKLLSTEVLNIEYSKKEVKSKTWLDFAGISHSSIGYVALYDGTIIRASGMVEKASGITKKLDVYINAVNQGTILTFQNTSLPDMDFVPNLNIDFAAGDVIRVRGDSIDDKLKKVVISLNIKWRLM